MAFRTAVFIVLSWSSEFAQDEASSTIAVVSGVARRGERGTRERAERRAGESWLKWTGEVQKSRVSVVKEVVRARRTERKAVMACGEGGSFGERALVRREMEGVRMKE